MKKIIIFLSLLLSIFLFSCDKKQNELILSCNSDFSVIHVKNFQIGKTFVEIKNDIDPFKLKLTDSSFENFKTYSFTDNVIYNRKKLFARYYFTFYKNLLVEYHFDIEADIATFHSMALDLYKDKNPLLNSYESDKLAYSTESQNCKSFFYLINRNGTKLNISGGAEKK